MGHAPLSSIVLSHDFDSLARASPNYLRSIAFEQIINS